MQQLNRAVQAEFKILIFIPLFGPYSSCPAVLRVFRLGCVQYSKSKITTAKLRQSIMLTPGMLFSVVSLNSMLLRLLPTKALKADCEEMTAKITVEQQ